MSFLLSNVKLPCTREICDVLKAIGNGLRESATLRRQTKGAQVSYRIFVRRNTLSVSIDIGTESCASSVSQNGENS